MLYTFNTQKKLLKPLVTRATAETRQDEDEDEDEGVDYTEKYQLDPSQ